MSFQPLRCALVCVPTFALLIACGSSDDGGLFNGSGGGATTGGTTGTGGGVSGSAGQGGQAGTPTTGGTTGSGGQPGSGGAPGGAPNTGGSPNTGGTPATGGAPGTGGTPGYTLDNVCSKFPAQLCSLRKSCCTSVHGFDEANCIKNETADCQDSVKDVTNGAATFNPQNIDICLAQAVPILQTCKFHSADLAPYLETINSCKGIFNPKKKPGDFCNEDEECAASPAPHGTSGCGEQSGRCYQVQVVQPGQKCDSSTYCAKGTLCTSSASGNICSPIKAGDQCSGGLSGCGFGLYCSQGICKTSKESGSCTSNYTCQSFICQSFQCQPRWPVVSQRSCGKSG